jgi:uncharacterized membrane protein
METKGRNKTINTLYGFLILSTILGFVPNGMAFTASFALWVVTLIAAYIYRGKDTEDGLLYNHMTYLIGTIWIGTSFILIGTLIAAAWVYFYGNNGPLDTAIVQINTGAVPDEALMQAVMNEYLLVNKSLLITASIVAVGPAIMYFVYRVANGLGRAAKGYRLANPKSWL